MVLVRFGRDVPLEAPAEVEECHGGHLALHHVDAEIEIQGHKCGPVPEIDAGSHSHVEEVVELVGDELSDLDVEVLVANGFQHFVVLQYRGQEEFVTVVGGQTEFTQTTTVAQGGHEGEPSLLLHFVALGLCIWRRSEQEAGEQEESGMFHEIRFSHIKKVFN